MKHKCSICGKEFEFNYQLRDKLPPNFPFCSKRCKLIDLNRWLNEDYRISIPLPNANLIDEDDKREMAEFLLATGEVDEIIDEDVEQST
ncbi:TPA: DNA gyrase inhibitor YacG [Candidatus Poribacteria bacterium]|nr:DNA gyrase inhibitor YacG [Candidatus Poribacteria bacterium]